MIRNLHLHLHNLMYTGCVVPNFIDNVHDRIKSIDCNIVFKNGDMHEINADSVLSAITDRELAFRYCNSKYPHSLTGYRHIHSQVAGIVSDIGYLDLFSMLNDIYEIYDESIIDDEVYKMMNETMMLIGVKDVDVQDIPHAVHPIGSAGATGRSLMLLRRCFEVNIGKFCRIISFVPSSQILTDNFIFDRMVRWKIDVLTLLETMPIDLRFKKYMLGTTDVQDAWLGYFEKNVQMALLTEEGAFFAYIVQNTFMDNMKVFLDKTTSATDCFRMIYYLLLGNPESINVANLLIDMLKDKQFSLYGLHAILYNQIPAHLRRHISSVSHKDIQADYDEVRSKITIHDIDLKKQVCLHTNMPTYVKKLALSKINDMKVPGAEYSKQLTYVKTLLDFPWPGDPQATTSDSVGYLRTLPVVARREWILRIQSEMESHIYGHQEAKLMITYQVCKWANSKNSRGGILGLVGPIGVGKTLFAKKLGKALGLPFTQINLGGQNDGEILHGHGYTYSGSGPGMLVKKLAELGTSRCIILFDELDKCSSRSSAHNEIMSVLIHLTDGNMCENFQDRFFQGIDFPIKEALMIFSYNDPSKIDPILLDRITEVRFEGFNVTDKIKIAQLHIIPSICLEVGYHEVLFEDSVIEYIVNAYTNESGVRMLSKCLEKIILHFNYMNLVRSVHTGKDDVDIITPALVDGILMKYKLVFPTVLTNSEVGIVNSVYLDALGGKGVCKIQVVFSHVEDVKLRVTGNVGKIMEESIYCAHTAAINYLRQGVGAARFGIRTDDHRTSRCLHVHICNSTRLKDGPSASAACALAIISLVTARPIPGDTTVLAEIDLLGNLKKVGGIEKKVYAADIIGMKQIILSQENLCDIDTMQSNIVQCDHIDDVCSIVFS